MNRRDMKYSYLFLYFLMCPGYLIFGQEEGSAVGKAELEDVVRYHIKELKFDPQNLESAIILMESYYMMTEYRKAILYANIAQDIYQNRIQDTLFQSSFFNTKALFYVIQTRGKSRHKIADYRKAKIDYLDALEMNARDSDLLVDIGNLYYNLEKFDSALFYFKKAEMEFQDGFKSKFNMANTYYVLKEYDSALLYYDKSIGIKGDFPYAYFYKGSIYNELGSYDSAIEAFNKAIQIWPDKSEIYFRRGFALQSSGRYEDALWDWNTVIFLDSQNYNALRNRAIAYIELNDNKSALADLNNLITTNSAEKEAYYLRGKLYYNNRKFRKSLPDLEVANKNGMNTGELFYMLGDLYRRKKEIPSACLYFMKAKKMEYPFSEKNEKLLKECNDY